jgi:hypothetical protein
MSKADRDNIYTPAFGVRNNLATVWGGGDKYSKSREELLCGSRKRRIGRDMGGVRVRTGELKRIKGGGQ